MPETKPTVTITLALRETYTFDHAMKVASKIAAGLADDKNVVVRGIAIKRPNGR